MESPLDCASSYPQEFPLCPLPKLVKPRPSRALVSLIRGAGLGDNYCACPDFATNLLGTCKHIEFVLGKLERRRGGKAALERGFEADYSELFLRYGAERHIAFRPGRLCTPEF